VATKRFSTLVIVGIVAGTLLFAAFAPYCCLYALPGMAMFAYYAFAGPPSVSALPSQYFMIQLSTGIELPPTAEVLLMDATGTTAPRTVWALVKIPQQDLNQVLQASIFADANWSTTDRLVPASPVWGQWPPTSYSSFRSARLAQPHGRHTDIMIADFDDWDVLVYLYVP